MTSVLTFFMNVTRSARRAVANTFDRRRRPTHQLDFIDQACRVKIRASYFLKTYKVIFLGKSKNIHPTNQIPPLRVVNPTQEYDRTQVGQRSLEECEAKATDDDVILQK